VRSSLVGPTPIARRGAANAARHGPAVVAIVAAITVVTLIPGCAVFHRRGPLPDEVAKCRELSRQGAAAMEMGDWGQAEALLRKANDASPKDAETCRYLAEALWHRGAADEALVNMDQAVRLDPLDASVVVRYGEMLLSVGDVQHALAQAENAIRLDPRSSAAWALRGRVFWQANQTDRALADLHRALEYAPDNPDLLLDVAVLYRQRGQQQRCLTTLHHLLDTYPPGEEPQLALMLEGYTLAELGRPRQAADSLLAATHRGPPNAEVLYHLAQAQMASGEYAAASDSAQRALALDASHAGSRQLLSELATRSGAAAESQLR
jgi:tetratricopeptide (TPR) repeat protein